MQWLNLNKKITTKETIITRKQLRTLDKHCLEAIITLKCTKYYYNLIVMIQT